MPVVCRNMHDATADHKRRKRVPTGLNPIPSFDVCVNHLHSIWSFRTLVHKSSAMSAQNKQTSMRARKSTKTTTQAINQPTNQPTQGKGKTHKHRHTGYSQTHTHTQGASTPYLGRSTESWANLRQLPPSGEVAGEKHAGVALASASGLIALRVRRNSCGLCIGCVTQKVDCFPRAKILILQGTSKSRRDFRDVAKLLRFRALLTLNMCTSCTHR